LNDGALRRLRFQQFGVIHTKTFSVKELSDGTDGTSAEMSRTLSLEILFPTRRTIKHSPLKLVVQTATKQKHPPRRMFF